MHEHLLASKYAFRLLVCKHAPSEEDEDKENRRRGFGVEGVFGEKHCMYFERKQNRLFL